MQRRSVPTLARLVVPTLVGILWFPASALAQGGGGGGGGGHGAHQGHAAHGAAVDTAGATMAMAEEAMDGHADSMSCCTCG